MLIKILIILGISILSEQDKLQTFTFSQIEELFVENPRNVFVYFSADWCQYCKNMEINTFRDSAVIKELNNSFYFVSFDAESKENVRYLGMEFKSTPSGYHEIVRAISGKNKVSLPYLVILNPDNEVLFEYQGFLDAERLLAVLKSI